MSPVTLTQRPIQAFDGYSVNLASPSDQIEILMMLPRHEPKLIKT